MGAYVMAAFAFTCFIFGEFTNNFSQVDKCWSVVPAIYAWVFVAVMPYNPRCLLVAICITIWALRLTGNACRRGFYVCPPWAGEEDYRWAVLRESPTFKGKRFALFLFNLFFISLYQMSLIYLFSCPAIVAHSPKPLFWADYVLAAFAVLLVVIEFISDGQ
jgi:steroid 5-alpha reductase family enzyme